MNSRFVDSGFWMSRTRYVETIFNVTLDIQIRKKTKLILPFNFNQIERFVKRYNVYKVFSNIFIFN